MEYSISLLFFGAKMTFMLCVFSTSSVMVTIACLEPNSLL
jgi:hypothetical protein